MFENMSGELMGHRVSKVECGRSGGSPRGRGRAQMVIIVTITYNLYVMFMADNTFLHNFFCI